MLLQGSAATQTVIMGDFKCENLFFRPVDGEGRPACGAVDYQWAGGGPGCVDVVYLLWTSLEDGLLAAREDALLNFYRARLGHYGIAISAAAMQRQYNLALLDFARFALADGELIEADVALMERAERLLFWDVCLNFQSFGILRNSSVLS